MLSKNYFSTNKIRVKQEGISPRKHWGQVFLKDKKYVSLIASTAEIKLGDLVIEIGAGTGILTQALLEKGTKVIALEKDPRLTSLLQQKFANYKNLSVLSADARNYFSPSSPFNLRNLNQYKVIGNIPYYLTSYLLRLFLKLKTKPKLIVLTVQKEVALRITAKPPQMNLLATLLQLSGRVKIIKTIPRQAFWPIPKVDSAIIKIILFKSISPSLEKLLKTGFSHKRKYLLTNLSKYTRIPAKQWQIIFNQIGIPLTARAQELTLKQWKELQEMITL